MKDDKNDLADEWARANAQGAMRRARMRRAALLSAAPIIIGMLAYGGIIFATRMNERAGKATIGESCVEKDCADGSCIGMGGHYICVEGCFSGAKCPDGFTCVDLDLVAVDPLDSILDQNRKQRDIGTRLLCVPDQIAATVKK